MLRLSDVQKMRMLKGEELLLNLSTLVVASFEGKLCTVHGNRRMYALTECAKKGRLTDFWSNI